MEGACCGCMLWVYVAEWCCRYVTESGAVGPFEPYTAFETSII